MPVAGSLRSKLNAWHKPLLERRGGEYDPRVRTRIERASDMTAVEYIRLRVARGDLIGRGAAQTSGFDALMPTVAITAPPIAALEQDEDYRRLNALLLRNTSVINFLDRCAITVLIRNVRQRFFWIFWLHCFGPLRAVIAGGRIAA
jgi:aspartyl-tRNA(Asn)/glutamyl-tRNA(Gln) amidotransferase subunit A